MRIPPISAGFCVKRNVQALPINLAADLLKSRSLVAPGDSGDRAFHPGRAALQFQFHQALEMRQDADITARLLLQHLLAPPARTRFSSSRPFTDATAKQLLRVAPGLFGNFHLSRSNSSGQLFVAFLRPTVSGRPCVRILPVTCAVVLHHQTPDFRFRSANIRA